MYKSIPGCSLTDQCRKRHGEELQSILDAQGTIEQESQDRLLKAWSISDFHKCGNKLRLFSVREESPEPGALPTAAELEDAVSIEEVRMNLIRLFGDRFKNSQVRTITDIVTLSLDLFAPHGRWILTDPETKELHYRIAVLDPILRSVFADTWMRFVSGEVENNQIARARAGQRDAGSARGFLHDGMGYFLKNDTKLEALFVEVVGGPNVRDAAKERQDREKLVKAIAVSVDVQMQLAAGAGEDFSDKIFAGGILVHGRKVSLMGGQVVNDKILVGQLGQCEMPCSMDGWHGLGDLVKRLVFMKLRLWHLYSAVRPHLDHIPCSSLEMTPGKGVLGGRLVKVAGKVDVEEKEE
ncbi:hypothetical protein HK097_009675 [Rhizophlyctis rosea]|uniref:Uncharacterized protein n=1 Tax=Rhizophlyctis rosea TaxID=64517 RepID=A0AAD5SBD6_9FUNG|nr:hypothetical protein HK097_009675 [Rhizophlyctis rosea]